LRRRVCKKLLQPPCAVPDCCHAGEIGIMKRQREAVWRYLIFIIIILTHALDKKLHHITKFPKTLLIPRRCRNDFVVGQLCEEMQLSLLPGNPGVARAEIRFRCRKPGLGEGEDDQKRKRERGKGRSSTLLT
jgi:hypothetical protein